jgi:hypothetical protein
MLPPILPHGGIHLVLLLLPLLLLLARIQLGPVWV